MHGRTELCGKGHPGCIAGYCRSPLPSDMSLLRLKLGLVSFRDKLVLL